MLPVLVSLLTAATALPTPNCDTVIPDLASARYRFTGQQRNIARSVKTSSDFQVSGIIETSDQNGLLTSMALTTFGKQQNDTYHFVCTFTPDDPHVATCTLTFEEPSRAQGPAWVTAKFHNVTHVSLAIGVPKCIAKAVTVVGSYPFSSATDDAGIYAMTAIIEEDVQQVPVHKPSKENLEVEDTTNVLIVYASDGNDQVLQIAKAVGEGATSASATVKIVLVQDADYKRDVLEWAHAVILGSGVYNGNPAPDLLSFVNSFDFEDRLTSKVGGAFAAGGSAASGLESTLDDLTRSLRTFGIVTLGGNSWQNAHGTGIVTNGSEKVNDAELSLARDQGARITGFATMIKESSPTPSPGPVIDEPPSWGQTWKAIVTANLTQVGYDAGLVIVNFTGRCETPATQRMVTVYGDFDTVLTRCDMGYEFIIDPPSRGGACHPRVIGRDVDSRICEACSCPFCVRDTNGSFTHGEKYPSKTVWESKDAMNIMGVNVNVWQGKAVSAIANYALHTSIAYSADDPSVPLFVNVTHPLWVQTSARIDHFSRTISTNAFDIPANCFAGVVI